MAPASNEEQFKFLISCIRYSNNGKQQVDFGQVARECKIVSKGAAAKRYERMMRAHGIAPNAATIKPAPARNMKIERRESSTPSSTSSKKRKADAFLEDTTPVDDDETYGNIKPDPINMKEQFVVKEESEGQSMQQGQLSINQAANLMQYYDSPATYGSVGLSSEGGYGGSNYGGSAGYSTPIASAYGLPSQQPYDFSTSYNAGSMNSILRSENQGTQYQSLMPYQADDQGRSDSPVIVE
ncbi:hypothetical protein BDZ45DRAFT_691931 [Acephala macrosclerotiorum]|nr:hypothetical protein BDZ45DRAFT_691931 [Acephala macrosclerotiorum]